jgi:hypothetical protein
MNLILSFPFARHLQPASLVRPSRAVFNQILLGGQGQLHALLPQLKTAAANLFVCAAPEIFMTPESFEPLREAIRRKSVSEREITHLRFGPTRYSCVLKGTRNKSVIAERENRDIYSSGMSPFAVGDVLPAAFSEALLLLDAPRGLRLPDGGKVAEHVLGAGFGIPEPEDGLEAPHPARADDHLPGLDVMAAADFDAALWEARRTGDPLPAVPESFLALAGRHPSGAAPSLVLVPWNMADPGGFAVNLLERYLDEPDPLRRGVALALMPFNETFETPARLNAAIASIKRHPLAQALLERGVFFVSVATSRALPELGSLFSCFVADAADPEFSWSFRRLCTLGLRPVVFGAESLEEIGLDADSAMEIDFFPFELSDVVHQPSPFGAIHVEAGRISRRQFRALLNALQDGGEHRGNLLRDRPSAFVAADPRAVLQKVLQG